MFESGFEPRAILLLCGGMEYATGRQLFGCCLREEMPGGKMGRVGKEARERVPSQPLLTEFMW